MPPQLITTKAELRAWRARWPGEVRLVPTMGALHEGHATLMRAATGAAGLPVSGQPAATVVSIFVNPLQFGPHEDLSRYPRTLEADLAVCAAEGVDVVFAPSEAEMYAADRQVGVSSGTMGTVLEGASRPGHFDGVLTVVTKLFTLVRPDRAWFGLKDIQQFALVSRLVADLDLGVEVVGVPTVRDADGLALSSRNTYLSSEERALALTLSRALRAGAAAAPRRPSVVLAAVRQVLAEAGANHRDFVVDYAELVDFATFAPVAEDFTGSAVVALAVRVGSTRLIDNLQLEF